MIDPDAPADGPGHRQSNGQPVKRRRSIQTVTRAPEIIWLDHQNQIESEELVDRAGKYDVATNTLYLNGLYDAVQNKIAKLEAQYAQQIDWDSVRGLVIQRVRSEMALHIGSVVVYALAKQGRPAWTDADWKAAVSPQSLTVAADESDYLLAEIRRALKNMDAFKAAQVV